MKDDRVSGLHRLPIAERIDELHRRGLLSDVDAALLRDGIPLLAPAAADRIVENVLGVFALPFAVAPNFVVNDRDYLVPLVIEEPSVVAGLAFAAGLARRAGGFDACSGSSLLAGQVHVTGMPDVAAGAARIERDKQALIDTANSVHPRLVARGGGVTDIEVRLLELPGGRAAIAVHVLVDTSDAMGANIVNTVCEHIAPHVAKLSGGEVALRILSNFADRSLVTARVRYPESVLAAGELDGAMVRDAIVAASDIASVDVYRATTHNKGIMNGIDAVAIATGNDWRAIEAGAHAFASQGGTYGPLATWRADRDGALVGEIRLPLKVGIVGGSIAANPCAALGVRITAVASAAELGRLMAAVGLAQNFAALRALATSGIQHAHMRLHARSVAAAAGVPDARFDAVVTQMIAEGEIKEWRARELVAEQEAPAAGAFPGRASGKVILFGEHAVVYGRHAVALPIPGAVRARVREVADGLVLRVPDWSMERTIGPAGEAGDGVDAAVLRIVDELGVGGQGFEIDVHSELPVAMGLGSSAAFAVAVVRAFDAALGLELDDERVNAVAFECEKLAHGTPSGIDNSVATFGTAMLFRNGTELVIRNLAMPRAVPLVVACSMRRGVTHEQVAAVRARHALEPRHYDALFDEMDTISVAGAAALEAGEFDRIGRLMNIAHGLLCAIEVSTPELERMIGIARSAGAIGAKLTGAGGGGSIVALCPGRTADVEHALREAGYRTLMLDGGRGA